ncbi:MAG: hypothetical protein KGJ02_07440 [Verrucomicrobiota bacterium]|nr:hypothetical protein [Verrucomicrobiota bacterium]
MSTVCLNRYWEEIPHRTQDAVALSFAGSFVAGTLLSGLNPIAGLISAGVAVTAAVIDAAIRPLLNRVVYPLVGGGFWYNMARYSCIFTIFIGIGFASGLLIGAPLDAILLISLLATTILSLLHVGDDNSRQASWYLIL